MLTVYFFSHWTFYYINSSKYHFKSCSTVYYTDLSILPFLYYGNLRIVSNILLLKKSNAIDSFYLNLHIHLWLCPIPGTLAMELLDDTVREHTEKLLFWETIHLCPIISVRVQDHFTVSEKLSKLCSHAKLHRANKEGKHHTNCIQPHQGIVKLTSYQSWALHNLMCMGLAYLLFFISLYFQKVQTS